MFWVHNAVPLFLQWRTDATIYCSPKLLVHSWKYTSIISVKSLSYNFHPLLSTIHTSDLFSTGSSPSCTPRTTASFPETLWCQSYQTFFSVIYEFSLLASVCPWQAFPAYPIVCGQGQGPTLSRASERIFNRVGSCFTNKPRLSWKGLAGANTLAYYEHS